MTMSVIIALIDKIKSPDGVKRDPFKGVAKILFGLVASIAVLALIP